jgi:predicted DNA-binding transcriptional regulator YafY
VERHADGSVVAEYEVTDPGAFRSHVAGYLDRAEIVEPVEMREQMVAWLQRIASDAP